ncbi:NmrA family NAD(P)-binding protein [Saccharothrix syringae]|uniref:NmrA family NAD(P)-binding protein n=1 Tax=Saccharothrix syringae TaxID=103733 RepID=UPI001B80C7DA|nr:NmrA family NAD(P)-binding protein [Saccharothrix syringae]
MRTIAVVGATGLQGRAVTERLLADGWAVRALTRTPSRATGPAPFVGAEMDDVDSLVAAMTGAHGVFSVQPTVGSPGAPPGFTADDEVRWGRNVAEAARRAGVAHLVYSSVAGAGRDEELPVNVAAKARVERALDLPATVLRPVSFMENFTGAYALRDGAVATGLAPHVPQQLIAVDDVAALVALAFSAPGTWIGRAVDVAGDEPTPVEVAAAISAAVGRELPYEQVPVEAIRAVGEDFAFANEWLNERGYRADVAATRRLLPGAEDLRAWLARVGAARIDAFLSGSAR